MKSLLKLILPFLMVFHFSAHAQQTITDIVVASPDHNTLEAAVIAADLATTLASPGPFTVFAPTDAAFAALGQQTIDALLADPSGALTYVLTQHVVNGVASGPSIFDGQKMANLAGQDLTFSTSGGVTVNGINISTTDIRATNGVVHVIDAVINTPQTVVDVVVNSPDHNTLEAAVIAAGLAPTLASADFVTVFAPTDAAFAALGQETIDELLADPTGALAQILLYHVVQGSASPDNITATRQLPTLEGSNIDFILSGGGVMINNANVTVANIRTGNGIVHVIDAVLLPKSGETVVDIIVNSPDHNTLEAAVIAAGLAPALSSADFVTVFAPTDAAFAALGQQTIDDLLADPTGALADILLYHVVQGAATPANMPSQTQIATLAGTNLDWDASGGGVMINNANVTVANIRTNNGIVHVIDAVLVPDAGITVVDVIVNSPDHNTLETAVLAAGLEGALSGDGPFTVFAPTDAAFAALDPAVLNAALADPQGLLTQVLTYHVVNGVAKAETIFDGQKMATLLGRNIEFSTSGGVKVNNANIIVTDIETRNGVVHVIDAVLLP